MKTERMTGEKCYEKEAEMDPHRHRGSDHTVLSVSADDCKINKFILQCGGKSYGAVKRQAGECGGQTG